MQNFSQSVKHELAHIIPDKKCCLRSELSAILRLDSKFLASSQEIVIRPELPVVLRKIISMMNKLYFHSLQERAATIAKSEPLGITRSAKGGQGPEGANQALLSPLSITGKDNTTGKLVELRYPLDGIVLQILEDLGLIDQEFKLKPGINRWIREKKCCVNSSLRGLFLSGGYLNDPKRAYHLEITVTDYTLAHEVKSLFRRIGLVPRIHNRKHNYAIYLKRSDDILKALAVMEGYDSFLKVENVRLFKELKETANRQVNCDTYNVDRTSRAALRQIEAIKTLYRKDLAQELTASLVEVAEARLRFPQASISELGQLIRPKLSKQAVYHRMNRILEFARQKS